MAYIMHAEVALVGHLPNNIKRINGVEKSSCLCSRYVSKGYKRWKTMHSVSSAHEIHSCGESRRAGFKLNKLKYNVLRRKCCSSDI